MRVLVAVVAKDEEVHRARKHLGYDRLVLVVPRGRAAKLDEALEALPAARVEEVPEHDLLGCLERLEALLREHRRDEVRVAADGGTGAMSHAAFLACLAQGVEAWFLLKQPVRLPVLRALPVEQRFPPDQVAVLRACEGRLAPAELARRAGLPPERAMRAVYQLRREGVLEGDLQAVEPTPLGAYYRRGLGPA